MNLLASMGWRFFSILAVSANSMILIVYAFFARPVQDDYVTLEQLSQGNVLTPSSELVQHWGGNVVSVLIRSTLMFPSQFRNHFVGLSLFVFLTFALLMIAVYCFVKLVYGISLSLFNTLLAASILSLALEGIFSPTSLGIYAFSAASIVHFWPLCIFTIATYQIIQKSLYLGGILFFIGANCNLTEGFLAVCILIVLKFMGKIGVRQFLISISFSTLGLLAIILVPGFTERSDLFTAELSFVSIFLGVLKSIVIIAVDLLSHPGGYFTLLLGLFASAKFKMKNNISASKFTWVVFTLYFLGTTLGASIAYLAWHQTLGLLLLWYGLTFQIGVSLERYVERMGWLVTRNFLFALIAALIILNLRPLILIAERAHLWDTNYTQMFCSELGQDFESAEIIYGPFNLGIEDVDKWEWMQKSFSHWVGQNGISSAVCR